MGWQKRVSVFSTLYYSAHTQEHTVMHAGFRTDFYPHERARYGCRVQGGARLGPATKPLHRR
jgi:hypothetical protein